MWLLIAYHRLHSLLRQQINTAELLSRNVSNVILDKRPRLSGVWLASDVSFGRQPWPTHTQRATLLVGVFNLSTKQAELNSGDQSFCILLRLYDVGGCELILVSFGPAVSWEDWRRRVRLLYSSTFSIISSMMTGWLWSVLSDARCPAVCIKKGWRKLRWMAELLKEESEVLIVFHFLKIQVWWMEG